jgi:molybdopterin/thiamine biosynthesis adenylyltransferase
MGECANSNLYAELVSRNSPVLDEEEQEAIRRARLSFVGCGLASQIAVGAARLGFTRFSFWDGDTVELGNLNRQAFQREHLGENKAEATARLIRSVNPDATCEIHRDYLCDSLDEPVSDADIVVNTADFGRVYVELADTAAAAGRHCILPMNLGFGGFTLVVNHSTPLLSELSPHTESEADFLLTLADNLRGIALSRRFQTLVPHILDESRRGGPFPQNAVATSMTTSLALYATFCVTVGRSTKLAPDAYHFDLDSLSE